MALLEDHKEKPSQFTYVTHNERSRGWEVLPIGEPLLLPPEAAETWKPWDLQHWADHLEPSPIERGDWGKTEPRS